MFKIVIKFVTKPMRYEKAVKSIAKSVEYYYNLLDANLHLKMKVCGVGSDMHRV